jgi:hypothetical protein
VSTYTPIASQTLSSAAASVTFSGIPQTYTDLVLVVNATWDGGSNSSFGFRLNSDSGSNYSITQVYGNGSSAASGRTSNATYAAIGQINPTEWGSTIFQFQNYSNTTTYKTALSRSNVAGVITLAGVGLWRSTSAVTSISVGYFDVSGNFDSGSTFNLYGINAQLSAQAKATGGDTIIRDTSYWYHVFNKSGTFSPLEPLSVDILAIAGGGGGGGTDGGGGGAGGLIFWGSQSVSNTSTIVIGAGGTGGAAYNIGTSGSNTTFASLTAAVGGGRGGGGSGPVIAGTAGGSGGGGAGNTGGGGGAGGASTQTGSGATSYYGNAGGTGAASDPPRLGAGGGGAGGVGGNGLGNGGAGRNSITGTTLSDWTNATKTGVSGYFAGGGGGGSQGSGVGSGGSGGGGIGGDGANGGNASTNTGSGGGGGGNDQGGGAGGSGIVIVRYSVS